MIIYWSREDNWFIVEVPGLPGFMADDETYDEAVKAFVVIKEWMETAKQLGREIPEPKDEQFYV